MPTFGAQYFLIKMNQSQIKYDDDAVTNPIVKSEATRTEAMTAKDREDKKREFEWLLYYSGLKPSLGISI